MNIKKEMVGNSQTSVSIYTDNSLNQEWANFSKGQRKCIFGSVGHNGLCLNYSTLSLYVEAAIDNM